MVRLRSGAIAATLGLCLIFGSMILGAGPSASAEGPASVFYGYVFAGNGESTPPARIRALSASGVVCGTADVMPSALPGARFVGFYAIAVASASQKAGCPSTDSVVQFTLVASRVDDGQWADRVALARPGETQQVNLSASVPSFPGWLIAPAGSDGSTVMRWVGAPSTPLTVALSSIPLSATAAARPTSAGVFAEVPLAASELLATDDLVLVRFR